MSVKLRERKLKDGSSSLVLDIYVKGRRKFETLELRLYGNKQQDKETKQLAEAIRAKRELQIYEDTFDFNQSRINEFDLVEFFEVVADEFLKKENPNRNYRSCLTKLKQFAGRNLPIEKIDKSFCAEFRDYLDDNLSRETARIYFTIFKAVLNRALDDECIKHNPAARVDNLPKKQPEIKYLHEWEVEKLIHTDCDRPRVKEAFLFACNTGLRFSDVKGLKWQNIKGSLLTVRMQKSKKVPLAIPLNEAALRFAGDRQKDHERVFDIPDQSMCWQILKKWSEVAGIQRVHFHMARHTFATMLLNNGADPFTVRDLLGHSDISSTMIYARITDKTKKSAVGRLPNFK